MSTSKLKAVIIVAVVYFIVCFAIMRIHSIPLEEEALLEIIIFGFVVLNLVVWKIWDARKAKKEDKQ